MRDFPTFHRIHESFFGASPPALTVIEVNEVGHKGTLIEIEPTAILSSVKSMRKVTDVKGSPPLMHMSPIVEADGLAFLSGLMPVDESGEAIESAKALPAAVRTRVTRTRDVVHVQTHAVLHQLKTVLKVAGRDLRSVAQLTIYLQNIEDLPSVAPLVLKAFGKWLPSGTVVEARFPAPAAGVRVSMTATAWFGDQTPLAH
jgi:enamine deaminase RidA (YjgF/YER057c/UK114 family)